MLRALGPVLWVMVGLFMGGIFTASTGPALASLSSLVAAWGHDFTVTPFEAKDLTVARAMDKATGATFNVVEMPNGHLMAIVPLTGLKEPPKVDPSDVM